MSSLTITEVIAAGLREFASMHPDAAERLAREICCAAAKKGLAGSQYYLPAMHTLTRAQRNEAIRREFNGRNLRELMKKYSVHKSTIYRAVRRGE